MPEGRGPHSGFAEVNGVKLYYEVAGAGTPLVLLHAGIADSRMWDDQWEEFARSHRVIRYDMRGFGRTAMVDRPFAHRHDLYALLQALGVGRVALLGCSMGGATAIDFALEHPDLVATLIPVACLPGGYQRRGTPPPQWDELSAAEERGDLARVAELEVQIWVDGPYRGPGEVAPAIRDRVRAMNLVALASDEARGEQEQRLAPPAVDRLHELRAPTLVIVGDQDNPDVAASSDLLAARIPGARKAVIGGAAHLPNMERPAEFNRLVMEFLAGLPRQQQ